MWAQSLCHAPILDWNILKESNNAILPGRDTADRPVGQAHRIVQLATGQQSTVGGDHRTREPEHQTSVEIEPQRLALRFTRSATPRPNIAWAAIISRGRPGPHCFGAVAATGANTLADARTGKNGRHLLGGLLRQSDSVGWPATKT